MTFFPTLASFHASLPSSSPVSLPDLSPDSTSSGSVRHAGLALAVSLLAGCGGGGGGGAEVTASGGGSDTTAKTTSQPNETALLQGAVAADFEVGGLVTDASALRLRRFELPPQSPTPPPAPVLSPALATTLSAASADTTCGLPDFQAALLARINQYRAAGASCRTAGDFPAAGPLAWSTPLQQAAAGHSRDMAANNYFSHTGRDGRSMVDRVNATGYLWSNLGENIAAGYPSVAAVVDGWMASDGHCANLMNPSFRDVGLACVANSSSTYKNYWTMDGGRPR